MRLALRRGGLVVSCQARADNPLHGAVVLGTAITNPRELTRKFVAATRG